MTPYVNSGPQAANVTLPVRYRVSMGRREMEKEHDLVEYVPTGRMKIIRYFECRRCGLRMNTIQMSATDPEPGECQIRQVEQVHDE